MKKSADILAVSWPLVLVVTVVVPAVNVSVWVDGGGEQ